MFLKAPILLTRKIKLTIIMIISWRKDVKEECLTKKK